MTSRWDKILESKPVPIFEHLIEEVSKLLAKDLESWPPPIQELDLATGSSFQELFAPDYAQPLPVAYREAFQLARWNLTHQLDAYDDYMRNQRWLARGLPSTAKLELLFLSRWLEEQMHGLSESTSGRVKRKQMLEILEKVERRLGLLQLPS
ncbi:MAG: hypothetical protein M3Y59_09815 [Myxococcota bacterium]|nr:hypothetical protein [Myxococcota bacterium]